MEKKIINFSEIRQGSLFKVADDVYMKVKSFVLNPESKVRMNAVNIFTGRVMSFDTQQVVIYLGTAKPIKTLAFKKARVDKVEPNTLQVLNIFSSDWDGKLYMKLGVRGAFNDILVLNILKGKVDHMPKLQIVNKHLIDQRQLRDWIK